MLDEIGQGTQVSDLDDDLGAGALVTPVAVALADETH